MTKFPSSFSTRNLVWQTRQESGNLVVSLVYYTTIYNIIMGGTSNGTANHGEWAQGLTQNDLMERIPSLSWTTPTMSRAVRARRNRTSFRPRNLAPFCIEPFLSFCLIRVMVVCSCNSVLQPRLLFLMYVFRRTVRQAGRQAFADAQRCMSSLLSSNPF